MARLPDREELFELYPGLLLYAARWVRICALPADPEDLVQTAVGTMFEGACPDEVPAGAYLRMRIRQLATNERRHLSIVPMRSMSEQDAKLADPRKDGIDLADVAVKVVGQLRALAHEDGEVLAMIQAIEDGYEKRREIAAAAGLPPKRLDAARKRLGTLITKLPSELRTASEEVLGSA